MGVSHDDLYALRIARMSSIEECIRSHARRRSRRKLACRPDAKWLPVVRDNLRVQRSLSNRLGLYAPFLYRSVCVGVNAEDPSRVVLDYILFDAFSNASLLSSILKVLAESKSKSLSISAFMGNKRWICARRFSPTRREHADSLLKLNHLMCFYSYLRLSPGKSSWFVKMYLSLRDNLLSATCLDGFSLVSEDRAANNRVVVDAPAHVAYAE